MYYQIQQQVRNDVSDQQVFNTSTKVRIKSRPTCYTVQRLRTVGKTNVKPNSDPWEKKNFHDQHNSQFSAPHSYVALLDYKLLQCQSYEQFTESSIYLLNEYFYLLKGLLMWKGDRMENNCLYIWNSAKELGELMGGGGRVIL